MWATHVLLRRNPDVGNGSHPVYSWRRIFHLIGLTDAEKVAVRRHCGYPAYGATAAGFSSWRFYQVYGLLEYRMNNLVDEEQEVVRNYLKMLMKLEASIPEAADNLDTSQAAIWRHNDSEVSDRSRLYDNWRLRLCGFLGLPAGPALSTGTISWVV